jgi:hypothetical protein
MGAFATAAKLVAGLWAVKEAKDYLDEQKEEAKKAMEAAAKQVPAAPPGQPNEPVIGVRDITPGSTIKKRRLGTKKLQYQPNILTIPTNTGGGGGQPQPLTGLGIPKAR